MLAQDKNKDNDTVLKELLRERDGLKSELRKRADVDNSEYERVCKLRDKYQEDLQKV